MTRIEQALTEAEHKAWDSLGRYKFQMFGYWAAIWVHLNKIGQFRNSNPFVDLVTVARTRKENKMTKVKKSMIVEQEKIVHIDKEAKVVYKVVRVVNATEPEIYDRLEKDTVERYIADGYNVTIKPVH